MSSVSFRIRLAYWNEPFIELGQLDTWKMRGYDESLNMA